MKKLRLVILSLSSFSLICSTFFYIALFIYNKTNNLNETITNDVKIPIASNYFIFLSFFLIVLVWYIYHKKDRAESITNGLMLLIHLIYSIVFAFGLKEILGLENFNLVKDTLWYSFSIILLLAPGMWIVISIIPTALHFIASIQTGGYDNVPEPDNIYGFMFTIIGICYILTMISISLTVQNDLFTSIFELYENGLIISLCILTFILCSGLRFNSAILDSFNILMQLTFTISWIVIPFYNSEYTRFQKYLCLYHLLMVTPMFVLSIFILKHYIQIDRFYKSRTSIFLDK